MKTEKPFFTLAMIELEYDHGTTLLPVRRDFKSLILFIASQMITIFYTGTNRMVMLAILNSSSWIFVLVFFWLLLQGALEEAWAHSSDELWPLDKLTWLTPSHVCLVCLCKAISRDLWRVSSPSCFFMKSLLPHAWTFGKVFMIISNANYA